MGGCLLEEAGAELGDFDVGDVRGERGARENHQVDAHLPQDFISHKVSIKWFEKVNVPTKSSNHCFHQQ